MEHTKEPCKHWKLGMIDDWDNCQYCKAIADEKEYDELKQQRDELQRDAERYRWLRDKGFGVWPSSKALLVYQGVNSDHSLLPEELDSAIDAAIAKEQK